MMALLSQARRLHAEDLARLRVEAHAAEALAAAAQGLDGVDPERAEDLLELVAPGMHEVGEALGVNAIESLRGSRERLRGVGLDAQTCEILGVKPAGL